MNPRRTLCLGVFIGSVVLFSQVALAEVRLPSVVINEIMFDPADQLGTDDDYEWIELYNTTNQPISLVGWTLNDISLAGTIAAHDYAIVARQDRSDPDQDGEFFTAYYNDEHGHLIRSLVLDLLNAPLRMEGDEFEIELHGPQGQDIDEAEFHPAPGGGGDGSSLERILTLYEPEHGQFAPSNPEADHGSPAAQNSVAAVTLRPWVPEEEIARGDSLIVFEQYRNNTATTIQGFVYREAVLADSSRVGVGPPEEILIPAGETLELRRAFYVSRACPLGLTRYRAAIGAEGRSINSAFDEFIVATGDQVLYR